VTVTVADLDGQEVTEPRTVGNDESKRWRGGKGCSVRVEERANWCYAEILNGGTRRQITQKLADRFNVSQRTADEDYSRATELLKTEQIATRSELLNQIQALRLSACRKAMAKGQLQTVAMLLKDMGAVIGEAAPEQQAAAAPILRVEIDDKRAG
jgi:predicted DNA-binding transcriptional regulator YafY